MCVIGLYLSICSSYLLASDWVVTPVTTATDIIVKNDEITLENGIVRRKLSRAGGGFTTSSLYNIQTKQEMLSSNSPAEAIIKLDGVIYKVGGSETSGYQFVYKNHVIENTTLAPYAWSPPKDPHGNVKAYTQDRPWPAVGKSFVVTFEAANIFSGKSKHTDVQVKIRYEIFKGIAALMKKITVENTRDSGEVRLNDLTLDILNVSSDDKDMIYFDSDFHGSTVNAYRNNDKDRTYIYHSNDEQYRVLYREAPNVSPLYRDSSPEYRLGKNVAKWGQTFESFRSFILLHSSQHYEAKMMEVKQMYRTLAPQITESPLFYHVLSDDVDLLTDSIETASAIGFEAMIQSFGSGFTMENTTPEYQEARKAVYAKAKNNGLQSGAYSLLTTGTIFNPSESRCTNTAWATVMSLASSGFEVYRSNMASWIANTGMSMIEIDGTWPLFSCAETNLKYADGGPDTVHKQWVLSNEMYRFLRQNNVNINGPDWHFFNGVNKTGIGYQETAWSTPRQAQLVLGRQFLYNGTYEKAPTMAWTFLPVAQYHGGGKAAAFQPLKENIFDYSWAIAQNLLGGVNPTFRGQTLDDGDDGVRSVVKYWVDVYKTYRNTIWGDIIHLSPPRQNAKNNQRTQSIDGFMHVVPDGNERALVALFNQTGTRQVKTITVPLYYTGLTDLMSAPQPVPGSYLDTKDIPQHGPWPVEELFPKPAWNGAYPAAFPTAKTVDFYQEGDIGTKQTLTIDTNGNALLHLDMQPMSFTWFIVTPEGIAPAVPPIKPTALPRFEQLPKGSNPDDTHTPITLYEVTGDSVTSTTDALAYQGKPEYLIDKDLNTWFSTGTDKTYIYVDLHAVQEIDRITIVWDDLSYAKSYKIETTEDGSSWTRQRLVFQTGTGGAETTQFAKTTKVRAIRIQLDQSNMDNKGTHYKIYEIRMFRE